MLTVESISQFDKEKITNVLRKEVTKSRQTLDIVVQSSRILSIVYLVDPVPFALPGLCLR
jgi:hypothetical protein